MFVCNCCTPTPCPNVCVTTRDACTGELIDKVRIGLVDDEDVEQGHCFTAPLGHDRCCVGVEAQGAYTIVGTKEGYQDATASVNIQCPGPTHPATYGPVYASAAADDDTIGTGEWSDPSNATGAADGTAATATSIDNTPTHYLSLSGFDLGIPEDGDESIVGITVAVRCKADAASTDYDVRLVRPGDDGPVLEATNKAAGTALPVGSYGTISYTWSNTTGEADWQPHEVNDSTFGVVFSAKSPGNATGGTPTDTGAIYASSCVQAATGESTVAWTNPGNATANDGVSATCVMVRDDITRLLEWTGLGLAVPIGSTINGVKFELFGSQNSGNLCSTRSCKLLKGGTLTGAPTTVANSGLTTTPHIATFGSSTDLWGTTLAPADVNAANFGIAWNAIADGSGGMTASVDWGRVTVYYTPPGPTTISVDAVSVTVETVQRTYEVTLRMPIAADKTCQCLASGTSICPAGTPALAKEITLNDGIDDVTLTATGNGWGGSATRTAGQSRSVGTPISGCAPTGTHCVGADSGSVSVTVTFALHCTQAGTLSLTMSVPACGDAFPCSNSARTYCVPGGSGVLSMGISGSHTCDPLLWTGSKTLSSTDATGAFHDIYGDTLSVTINE